MKSTIVLLFTITLASAGAASAQSLPIRFIDATHKAGLDGFRHRLGSPDKPWIVDAMGSGVAVADYDGDGDDDVYFLNGRPRADRPDPAYRNALFRNDGGVFTDVTGQAGVGDEGVGMAAVFFDADGDGWLDLYVGNYGPNVFYHNNGDGTFTDATEESGLADEGYAAALGAADYDRDGDADLFVGNYVRFDPDEQSDRRARYHGREVFLGPLSLDAQWDRLFENDGAGRFQNTASSAGVNPSKGRAMGAAFFDFDNDGLLDLYVTNDSTFNHFLHNEGGRFDDWSFVSGGGFSDDGRAGASMGVSVGDYDNDGYFDLYITSYEGESDELYRNSGDGQLIDASATMGLFGSTRSKVTWGNGFCDFDADGWLDVYTANGHVYPQADSTPEAMRPYRQGVSVYRQADGRFHEQDDDALPAAALQCAGRGSALLDYDDDGDMDIVINCIDSAPLLLENVSPRGNWLQLRLRASSAQINGMRIVARAGSRRWTRMADAGSSYLSQNSALVHFGFGEVDRVDVLTLYWPGREPQVIANPALNRRIELSAP